MSLGVEGRGRTDRTMDVWRRGSLRKRDFFFSKETWPSADKWSSARGGGRSRWRGRKWSCQCRSERVSRPAEERSQRPTTKPTQQRARALRGHSFILQSITVWRMEAEENDERRQRQYGKGCEYGTCRRRRLWRGAGPTFTRFSHTEEGDGGGGGESSAAPLPRQRRCRRHSSGR